jgi:hypothetical protein
MAIAQPVQIQPSSLDVAATGVYLASLDDIGHSATVEAIVGQDGPMLSTILPYGVLVLNNSNRSLRAVNIKFQWTNTGGHIRSLWLTLASTESPSTFIAPGHAEVFTPVGVVNQYLARDGAKRKASPGQISNGTGTVTSQPPATAFPQIIKQQLDHMAIGKNFQANIEGVVFDDFTFVGSDRSFEGMQSHEPKVHR